MKWKGFTIVEMLIVLLMTSLLITTMIDFGLQIFKIQGEENVESERRTSQINLYAALVADMWEADSIDVKWRRLYIRVREINIEYQLDTSFVVRIRGDTRDTLFTSVTRVHYRADLLELEIKCKNGEARVLSIPRGFIYQ